jgi:UDP-N-acetylglucosamine diphosphorylase / glucose-1-phosphate thymidylyltransferase / UDP-N-acetylgalactosamine diphosphorylase / glucosamine-1-phosphate N-acetyltransferase / galactosamine-1-phosphate N-acetyltransferase
MKNTKSETRNTKQIRSPKSEIQNFYPLTYLRSVEELRCGARTLAEHPGRKINYLWDLIINLKEDLEEDLRVLGAGVKGQVHQTAVIYAPEKVLIEEGAEIEACAVLDARQGPIYIGKGTIIKAGANLRGPVSIGPECRIGGEVTHSIFHGYSNKAHYGFIGHSYIGEWVNLGAGTTSSNLKNNYGTVKVQIDGQAVDSGQQFLGCFIGDYAKLGIGTLITTGAVIGLGANVLGGKVTPKYVPNFQWDEKTKYRLEDFLKAAEAMMGRRGKKLTPDKVSKVKELYKMSNDQ